MKNLPPVGTDQTINGGVLVTVLAHGKQDAIDVAICQAGERIAVCIADAFDAPKPDYKGHANLAEMIKGHIANWQSCLEAGRDLSSTMEGRIWWENQLNVLADIEAAVDAELM